MEIFIVRIYRNTPASAREFAGTVERVGFGDRLGFSGQEQLLARLRAGECGDDGGGRPSEAGDAPEAAKGRLTASATLPAIGTSPVIGPKR